MIIVDNHDDTFISIINILKSSFCFNLPRHTLTIKIVKKNKTLPLPPLFNSCLTSSIATWFWRTLPAAFKASFAFWVCLSRAPKLGSLSPSLLSCLWTSWLDLACFPEWSIYDYLWLFMINNRWFIYAVCTLTITQIYLPIMFLQMSVMTARVSPLKYTSIMKTTSRNK